MRMVSHDLRQARLAGDGAWRSAGGMGPEPWRTCPWRGGRGERDL